MRTLCKLVSFLCLVTIFGSSFTACKTNQPQQEGTNSVKKPLETIQYTIMRNSSNSNYPEDGGEGRQAIHKALKEAGIEGVDFKLIFGGSGADYTAKVNLMIASGESPDMFDAGSVNGAAKFAADGVIIALDEYYKDMPNYTKAVRKEDIDALRYNGKSYMLISGYRPEPFNGPNTEGFLIRQDWLDTLGLKMPETIDDFYTVIKAFTYNDPDKNGKQDTYGLSGTKSAQFEAIFGAFGVMPGFWFERNGVIKQGRVLPETKEVLRLLQNWYKEGLIDKDFPALESKQLNDKVINSKVGIVAGGGFGVPVSNGTTAALVKVSPQAVRKLMPPPKGPKGFRGWAEEKPGYNDMMLVSKTAKDPARLLKLIDWCVSDEGARLLQFGIEGVDYTYDRQANIIKRNSNVEADYQKRGFGNPVRFVQLVDRRWVEPETIEALNTASKYTIKNAFWGSVQATVDYPEAGSTWSEYFIKIVTGALPADAWDEFVQKYYKIGGKEIEDQSNAEWQKMKKTK